MSEISERDDFVAVMAVDELRDSKLYAVEVDGKEVLVTKVDGEVHAFDGICTHEYAQLCDGELEDGVIWCPLHSSGFSLETGAATNPPAIDPLPRYDVQIDDGRVYVSRRPVGEAS